MRFLQETFEILYDHFKDTFIEIKEAEKIRDKYFSLLLGFTILLLLITITPSIADTAINSYLQEHFNFTLEVDVLQSAIWFSIFFSSMKYYQRNVFINRQYSYLHKLEQFLDLKVSDQNFSFSRTGEHYNRSFPLVSFLVYLFYLLVFPLVLISVLLLKLWSEISLMSGYFIFDLLMLFFILLLIIANWISIHKGDKYERMKYRWKDLISNFR